MSHNDIRHKLSDYIDGAVSAKEKSEIDEHLKTCAECSSALSELRKTIEQVREIERMREPRARSGAGAEGTVRYGLC
jgi:anti-sigma factor RsiW